MSEERIRICIYILPREQPPGVTTVSPVKEGETCVGVTWSGGHTNSRDLKQKSDCVQEKLNRDSPQQSTYVLQCHARLYDQLTEPHG